MGELPILEARTNRVNEIRGALRSDPDTRIKVVDLGCEERVPVQHLWEWVDAVRWGLENVGGQDAVDVARDDRARL